MKVLWVMGRDGAPGRPRGRGREISYSHGILSFLPELDQLFWAKHTSHMCCGGGSVEKGLEGKNRSSQKRISVRGQNLCSQTRVTNPLSHVLLSTFAVSNMLVVQVMGKGGYVRG